MSRCMLWRGTPTGDAIVHGHRPTIGTDVQVAGEILAPSLNAFGRSLARIGQAAVNARRDIDAFVHTWTDDQRADWRHAGNLTIGASA